MIYAVIDTNVIVSALIAAHDDSPPVQIVKKLFSGDITPLYSRAIMDEYYRVLRREKFSFSKTVIGTMLGAIEQHGLLIESSPTDVILLDMKDLPFYEVALGKPGDNSYLVTGNLKHFPSEGFIVTPRQMLDIFKQLCFYNNK